jgi:hypothetical protein
MFPLGTQTKTTLLYTKGPVVLKMCFVEEGLSETALRHSKHTCGLGLALMTAFLTNVYTFRLPPFFSIIIFYFYTLSYIC